jgi:hypothetical protein
MARGRRALPALSGAAGEPVPDDYVTQLLYRIGAVARATRGSEGLSILVRHRFAEEVSRRQWVLMASK